MSTISPTKSEIPKSRRHSCGSDAEYKLVTPDQVLNVLGANNPYLVFIWSSMCVVWCLSAMPMMVSAFITADPCKSANNTTTTNCSHENRTTPTTEFRLLGEKAYLVEYTTSAFLVGVAIGSTFLPIISDRYGRRIVLILSLFFLGLFGCLSTLSRELYSFTIMRFIQGIFFTGCGETSWILAYESIPLQLRSYTALIFGLMWVTGYCLIAPLAYFLHNWRDLVVAVSTPSMLVAVFFFFTIPDSFHHLIAKEKVLEVEKWVSAANRHADWRGSPKAILHVGDLCAKSGPSEVLGRKSGSFGLIRQLLKSRVFVAYTLVMVTLWACDAFIYYGLSLFSTQLAGNRYINYVLVGLVEVPSYVISPFMLDRLGRRLWVSLCHFLAALSFLIIIFTENSTVSLMMWLLGKFAISSSFTCLFVYASEVFPTVARNGCIGLCSVLARVGGSLAPTVRTMASINPIMPTLFFGVFAAVGGGLTLLLPETKDYELPDTVEGMNALHERRRLTRQSR